MGTEFKTGDRLRVLAAEGKATCVVDYGNHFAMDVHLDDGRKLTVRDKTLVELVAAPPPAPGTVFKFDGAGANDRFVMQAAGKMARLWGDGFVSTGYTWEAQSVFGRKRFTVISEG